MQIYYSPSTGGFYSTAVHDVREVPRDAVKVSKESHAELLVGHTSGKLIVHDEDGMPFLCEPPPLTDAQLSEHAAAQRTQLLQVAAQAIAPLQDAIDLGEATEQEETQLLAWKSYRIALSRIEQQPGYPQAIQWPTTP